MPLPLEGLASHVATRDATATPMATHEQQVMDLSAELGRLTAELSWLRYKLPWFPLKDAAANLYKNVRDREETLVR